MLISPTLQVAARRATENARRFYDAGQIDLVEHEGMRGVWADHPEARFFIALETPHERSTVVDDGNPDNIVHVWAKGKKRHQQLRINTRTGTVENLADVLDDLEALEAIEGKDREEIDEEEVELAEVEAEFFLAEGEDGHVPLLIELSSGDVLNWQSVRDDVRLDEHPVVEIALREAQVHEYRKKDGTLVAGYSQERREGRFELPGHRFLGHATAESGGEFEVHQNLKSTNQFALLDSESGNHAPPGTQTGPWEGYSGENLLGLEQGKHIKSVGHPVANPGRDVAATEGRKREAVRNIAKALTRLEGDLPAMLAKGQGTRECSLALAVTMIARHLFRIGDGVGMTRGEETRGLTELRPGQEAKDTSEGIRFDFVGKAGKHWLRDEEAPDTVPLLRAQIAGATDDDRLWWYATPSGKHRQITPEDVRKFLEPYGFTPHRFRNYAASYEFYRFVRDYTKKNGIPEDEKDRQKMIVAATTSAAGLLNDTPGAAKVYILGELIDEVLNSGNVRDKLGLRPLRLAEGEESWWLPYEEDFIQWAEQTDPKFHHGMGEVDLGESRGIYTNGFEIWLWEALRPGDRWVTLKPHGPESDDYARVIIRQNSDGTATVVGGARHLVNLRLSKIGERKKMEAEESKKGKALTPEQKVAEQQKKEQREKAYDQAHQDFGSAVAKIIGVDGAKAEEIAKGYGAGLQKAKDPANKELEESRRREREERIQNGEPVQDKKLKTAIDGTVSSDVAKRVLEATVMNITGEAPKDLGGVSPEVQEAWAQARNDPAKMTQIAGLAKMLESQKRELKRQQSTSGVIRVMNRMAYTMSDADADAATQALLKDALAKTEYQLTSEFWHHVENAGLGVRDQFANGAVEGLTALSARFGGGQVVDASMIRLLGHEAMAAAIAADVRSRGESVRKDAEDSIHKLIESKHLPTVEQALTVAGELDDERTKIKGEAAAGNLMTAARQAALTQLTIARQKALGYSAGSLEAAAALADAIRQKNPQGADIRAGDERDRVVNLLQKAGLQEGNGYELRDDGKELSIHVPEEHLPKLLKAARIKMDLDEDIGAIKNHTAQSGQLEVPGMLDKLTTVNDRGEEETIPVKLKPGQISTVQFFEHMTDQGPDNGVYANVGVGLGKTLTQGAAAARLLSSGKATHGMIVVPAFLMDSTEEGMRKFFPDLDIQAAHPDKKKRGAQYAAKPQMMIVSLDTIRGDAAEGGILDAHLPALGESGYVFGDEAHLAFTPNENEDPTKQSARSQSMQRVRGRHMMMLTGTPLRRSSAEVWKVLNYLRPGRYGTLPSWMAKYGKMGEGVSAFGDSMMDLFQREINDATITEREDAPVQHLKNTRFIKLSGEQTKAYNDHDAKYYAAIKADPKMDPKKKRALVAEKIKNQRETIFGETGSRNSLIDQMKSDLAPHIERGERGIVHCTSIAAVDAVVAAHKPGEMLKVVGDVDKKERVRLLKGLNTGAAIVGGRAAIGDREGIVTDIDHEGTASVLCDDGSGFKAPAIALESKVAGVAGTSNAAGVLSAGLNLQGTNWNVHFQLPDSGATLTQRDARNLRTGQKNDVHSYYYVPETPTTRQHWRRLQQDLTRMKYVDDPSAYDADEFVQNQRMRLGKKGSDARSESESEFQAA